MVAVVIALVVVVGNGGATAVAADTNHGSSGDYTVFLPNDIDHYPGDTNRGNASIQHLAALEGTFDGTPSPKGYEAAGFLIIGNADIDFSQCSTENTAAFGIDRNNDAEGTETDESLLAAREDSQFNDHEIIIDFFDEGDLAGSTIDINDVDEIVAVQNQCYTMPTEPGWYQINGFLNGTGYDGTEFDVTLDSHYFYICECGSEQAAREQLGPPPSESGSGSGGTDDTEQTATPEPTATATTTATAAAGDDATPTPDDGNEATATGTAEPTEPTATTTAARTGTPEPTAEAVGDDGSDGTATAAGDGGSGGGAAGATATAERSAAGDEGPDAPATPTVGAGPGFGLGAALVGLLAVALLARRRG